MDVDLVVEKSSYKTTETRKCVVRRDVMRLDGARGKKQVLRTHVRRPFGSKYTVLKKVLVTLSGLSSGLAVIQRPQNDSSPGNCVPLGPPRYAPDGR